MTLTTCSMLRWMTLTICPLLVCRPTGHYNLIVTAERVDPEEAGRSPYIKFSYEVEAINEIKNPEEEAQAAVGMKFSQIFSPFKKDGTKNDFGIGFLKEAVAPFSAHFGVTGIGDVKEGNQQGFRGRLAGAQAGSQRSGAFQLQPA